MNVITAIALFAGIAAASPISARSKEVKARQDTVCPDPFDPCQYAEDDGTCNIGYSACIKKMGCNICVGGEVDCAGCALSCLTCD